MLRFFCRPLALYDSFRGKQTITAYRINIYWSCIHVLKLAPDALLPRPFTPLLLLPDFAIIKYFLYITSSK
ncbi:hypothetical protein BHC43_04415 [Snodgrassella alvi]|nr:hypothetical protein BHC43_04415 [Snodgrassella alvi]